jgi:imidazolonepropionase-like amidohydrolase
MQHSGYICEKGRTQGKLAQGQRRVFAVSSKKEKKKILLLFSVLFRCIPTDVDDLVVLVGIVDGHWHVVVGGNDLQWKG